MPLADPRQEIFRLRSQMEQAGQAGAAITPGVSDEDLALQQRLQQSLLGPAMAQASGGFGARGLSGSSLEAIQRSLMAGQIGLQSQQQMRDYGLQRGQFQLGQNRQLFDSLVGQLQWTKDTTRQKKKSGLGGTIGGILGAAAGSFIGQPGLGMAVGSGIGNAIGGAGGGGQGGSTPYDLGAGGNTGMVPSF